jgi:carbonic anhydrase
MSCPNSTAPVNIPTVGTTCSLKCEFSHNYPSSQLDVTHNGDYISFKLNPIQNAPVEYGNASYDVEEIRIYRQSIHTYIGEYADAELVIVHRNNMGSEKLLVCVPLMQSSTPDDNSIALDNVLSEVGKRANSNGKQTQINLASFNLNKFIPKKPFIIYNGTLPFSPCVSKATVNYIVFGKTDALKITPSSMNLLNNIVKKHNYRIKNDPKNGFFFNRSGPSSGTSSNEDIYIECKPTGSDGAILVPTASAWSISADTMNLSKVGMVIGILIGAIIMYALIKLMQYILASMKNKPNAPVSGGSSSANGISTARVSSVSVK